MNHLELFVQDENHPEGLLRVWNSVTDTWELENATDAQVLEVLCAAAVERAVSSARKSIQRARELGHGAPPRRRGDAERIARAAGEAGATG